MNINHKTAIITGGGRGIGLCIAAQWLDNGGRAVIIDIDPALKEFAISRLANAQNVHFLTGDVADEDATRLCIRTALQKFGRLDAIIHNAAISQNTPVEQLTFADWRRVIDVNLSAAFLLAKHAGRHLQKIGGCMVFISSTRALMSESNTEAYSASKAGLVGLTHALAMSLSPARVNCISPGWIVTDDWRPDGIKTALTEQDHRQHPVGRVGKPEDIATMALFLCSDQAAFISGQNIVIDGGMTKKMIYC